MSQLKSKTFNPEWQHFSFQNIPDLTDFTTFQQFKSGHIIFYEGHMPYGLFILASGEVEIQYGKLKHEIIKAPAFLGTSAFKNNEPYSGTAKVLIKGGIYFLSKINYSALNSKNHPVATWVNKFL